ncbi:hypothetical protein Tco_1114659 [Tanacetum coccineum]|uniref:Uncharacterized protein n=1 Tax=Tanacetum coccineum TaxID=301880 RepID=A0ABQ5IW47_9ASTR
MLDRKELTMTLDDFRTIFHLPQATDNNRDRFVSALKFSEMVPFYINNLGFTLELGSPSNFKTTGLVQPWQTLVRDKYHNLEDDDMVKSIFNSGKNKAGVGMKIPSWMITNEMKVTEHYRMYAAVFEVDVPMTQSQPIESTQGTHRTTSAPRSPNPDTDVGESSAPQKSTVIRLHTIQQSLAEQKSHDELEVKQKVQKVEEHLITEEIEKFVEGMKNAKNAEVDSYNLRKNDNQNDPGTRFEPRNNKESPEVELTVAIQPVNVNKEFLARTKFNVLAQHLQEVMEESLPKMVDDRVQELTKTQVPIYVAQGLIMKRQQNQADVAKMIADAIQQDHDNLRA